MTFWPLIGTLTVLSIGRRLGLLLVGVALYCIVVAFLIQWLDMPAVKWGSAATLINTVILGLLLGFRNRIAYERWWEARGLWGQLTNDCRNAAAKIAAFVPHEIIIGSRVAELLMAFSEALNRHLRDASPRLRDIPGFEHDKADPAHVPLYLARQIYAAVAAWKRDGHLDDIELLIIDAHLRGFLNVCGACEKIKSTPLAPSYRGLLRIGIVLNVLGAPWLTIPELGLWDVPILLLVSFFLLGLELIDSVVEEPFGPERDDLDLDRYCRTIRESVQMTLPKA
jgi:putative membrane protein